MVAVAAIVEDRASCEILLMQRSSTVDHAAGVWEGISGRMHQGEDPVDALRREIQEETGITEVEIVQPIWVNHFFRGPRLPAYEVVYIAYWCRTDDRAVTLSDEHADYCWVTTDEAIRLTETSGIQPSIEAFRASRAAWITQTAEQSTRHENRRWPA
jgi:8-oxo-dGTP diphosphatase